MKKLLSAACICLSMSLFAQISSPENTKKTDNRFFTGGGIGLQFGNLTLVDISPLIGYKLTEKWTIGLAGTYKYYRYREYHYDVKTDIYGGGVFTRYHFTDYLFGHLEFEYLSIEWYDFFLNKNRIWIESVFVGGGYRQLIGGNSWSYIMLLYNLNETPYSPYRNPIIRAGFTVGL